MCVKIGALTLQNKEKHFFLEECVINVPSVIKNFITLLEMQNAQSKISDQTTFQTYDSVQKYDDGITEKREFAITEHTMDTKHFLCRRS